MTPEEKQKLQEIIDSHAVRQRSVAPIGPLYNVLVSEIDFLLSLVKEQEATLDEWESHREGLVEAITTAENAASSMRSACVEKVREYLTDCRDEETGIIEAIASELESLSIQEQEK